MPPHRPLRSVLLDGLATFAGLAAFPGLASRLRRRSRLGPRLLLRVVVITTATFAARQWVVPWGRRMGAERDALERELGREPTPEELTNHLTRSEAS